MKNPKFDESCYHWYVQMQNLSLSAELKPPVQHKNKV